METYVLEKKVDNFISNIKMKTWVLHRLIFMWFSDYLWHTSGKLKLTYSLICCNHDIGVRIPWIKMLVLITFIQSNLKGYTTHVWIYLILMFLFITYDNITLLNSFTVSSLVHIGQNIDQSGLCRGFYE